VYSYLIDAPQPALIDTGVAGSPAADIGPTLRAAGVDIGDVKWILLTHGHWDHVGGAHAARSLVHRDAEVLLHHDDLDLLRSRRRHMDPTGYQAIKFRYIDAPDALAAHDALVMENISGELGVDRELDGGETFSLGGGITITVVHTPGHSAGSVTFLLEAEGWAFTGDTVQLYGSGPANCPLIDDPNAYRESLMALRDDVRPTSLFLGHRYADVGGHVLENRLDGEAAASAIDSSLDMEQKLRAASAHMIDVGTSSKEIAAIRPAAELLGFPADAPERWPTPLFLTLDSYLHSRGTA
jgi:glyoxylase-like metal-dependent hydrolase (beta-lactamase superfamily II)